eukprot:scaffold88416_cov36-Attheya_sp.AAC.4
MGRGSTVVGPGWVWTSDEGLSGREVGDSASILTSLLTPTSSERRPRWEVPTRSDEPVMPVGMGVTGSMFRSDAGIMS